MGGELLDRLLGTGPDDDDDGAVAEVGDGCGISTCYHRYSKHAH